MATTNLSRRNFAKGAALASALASIPAAAALAADTGADAELLDLCRDYNEIHAQRTAWHEENEAAYRRYCEVEPKKPEALRVKAGDRALRLPELDDYDHRLGKRIPREWYDLRELSTLEKPKTRRQEIPIRASDHSFFAPGEDIPNDHDILIKMVPWPEAQARADEIVAAYRVWDAECKAVMHSVGYDDTDARDDAFLDELDPLGERIIETPAKTLEGLRAKARAAAWFNDSWEDLAGGCTAEQLEYSLMRDLLELPQEAAHG